jgi:hypothetical protein
MECQGCLGDRKELGGCVCLARERLFVTGYRRENVGEDRAILAGGKRDRYRAAGNVYQIRFAGT